MVNLHFTNKQPIKSNKHIRIFRDLAW